MKTCPWSGVSVEGEKMGGRFESGLIDWCQICEKKMQNRKLMSKVGAIKRKKERQGELCGSAYIHRISLRQLHLYFYLYVAYKEPQ